MVGFGDFGEALEQARELNVRMADLTQALGDVKIPGAQAVEIAHPATHRQWQHPRRIRVSQAAAGFTAIATPMQGLHYVKLLGAFLAADAAGTIEFYEGAGLNAGTTGVDASITGLIPIATNGGFVLPVTSVENPWLWTEVGKTLSINTVTSKVSGWILYCDSPDNQ